MRSNFTVEPKSNQSCDVLPPIWCRQLHVSHGHMDTWKYVSMPSTLSNKLCSVLLWEAESLIINLVNPPNCYIAFIRCPKKKIRRHRITSKREYTSRYLTASRQSIFKYLNDSLLFRYLSLSILNQTMNTLYIWIEMGFSFELKSFVESRKTSQSRIDYWKSLNQHVFSFDTWVGELSHNILTETKKKQENSMLIMYAVTFSRQLYSTSS